MSVVVSCGSDKMSLWCGFLRIKRFITGKDEKIIINVGISRECMGAWCAWR